MLENLDQSFSCKRCGDQSINQVQMDLVDDRISNLPDDIIHRILSFLDMKLAVQTCTLSKRWEHVWTSMPAINLDSRKVRKFSKFVEHALLHRNSTTEVSAVDLTFTGARTQSAVDVVKYAYAHNARKLSLICFNRGTTIDFPQYLFTSHTLKHLTLNDHCRHSRIPKFAWDFPALETLNLANINLCDHEDNKSLDLFSKCVNLKDLTLHLVFFSCKKIFIVCAPQLSNLTMTDVYSYPKVFNVVGSQLKNLTLKGSVYDLSFFFRESTEGFDSLEQVNLSIKDLYKTTENYAPRLLSLFQKLGSAKFLTLNGETVETLSSCMDQLLLQPCPFNNLKCVKIVKVAIYGSYHIKSMATQVKNYLLENSPNATFIVDLPQKRSREQVNNDTMAKKVAKLETEIQMQNELIAEQKATLEAAKLQNEKFVSHIIKSKMAELKVQVESGNPEYEIIRSMGRDIKSVMDLMPESLRVNVKTLFFSKYEEVKSVLRTRIKASEWGKIETELKNMMHSQSSCSNNNQTSDVPAAKLSPAPRSSSANCQMATSSTVAWPASRDTT